MPPKKPDEATEETVEENEIFFDVHLHSYNLSHPGIFGIVNRLLGDFSFTFKKLLEQGWLKNIWNFITSRPKFRFIALSILLFFLVSIFFMLAPLFNLNRVVLAWIGSIFVGIIFLALIIFIISRFRGKKKRKLNKIINLLSIVENDLGRQFRYIELDYLSIFDEVQKYLYTDKAVEDAKDPAIFYGEINKRWKNMPLVIGENKFKKIILAPLIMDFGYKGFKGFSKQQIYYNLAPKKAVIEQTRDMFYGIRDYRAISGCNIMEIYPFLGINPSLYPSVKSLHKVLFKYFRTYKKRFPNKYPAYRTKFYKRFPANRSGQKILEDDKTLFAAGIKLYPPLEFDPWPPNGTRERKYVEFLYCYCQRKGIPITVHCLDGGWDVLDKETMRKYTSPEKWQRILLCYNDLKVNFAHFGRQRKGKKTEYKDWLKQILDFITCGNYPNVYADIAVLGAHNEDYLDILNAIDDYINICVKETNTCEKHLADTIFNRIMFGTDFMVHLQHIDSYYHYLKIFSETKHLSAALKLKMTNTIPKRFLFG